MSDVYDELGDESTGLTRRQVIKRVGIGAAVAWAAPAITTLGARAYASHGGTHYCGDTDWSCGDPLILCGSSDCALDLCLCDITVEGRPFCWNNILCGNTRACTTTDDCPDGWACATSCCETACLPPCGTCGPLTTSTGPNAAGV